MQNKFSISFLKILIVGSFLFSTNTIAQVTENWNQTYNRFGTSVDILTAVASDASGNLYVTGTSRSESQGENYLTIKYNSDGVEQWVRTYNNEGIVGDDEARAITVDKDGSVYVTGGSQPTGSSGNAKDFFTIKYNSEGEEQWSQRYTSESSSEDIAVDIYVDFFLNTYITGSVIEGNNGFNYVAIKYDVNGNELWTQSFSGAGFGRDVARGIEVDLSGNVFVSGYSENNSLGHNEFLLVKYNNAGELQWTKSYSGGANSQAYDLALDTDGNIYITGASANTSRADFDFFDYVTIKYNNDGVEQWNSRFSKENTSDNIPYSMLVDENKNVFITGYSSSDDSGRDITTIKYDNNGQLLWEKTYTSSGNNNDVPSKIDLDSSSGYLYIVGSTEGGISRMITLRYDLNGDQLWVNSSLTEGEEGANGVSVEVTDNGIIAVGNSFGVETSVDYRTILYSDSEINWLNVQWPPNGEINEGEGLRVYAKIRIDGITNLTAQSNEITSWIGINTENTHPSEWNEDAWKIAGFNEFVNEENDEYFADIGTSASPGVYYYASRFSYKEEGYSYGGYSENGGGFWNGTEFNSGVLTVNSLTSSETNSTPFTFGLDQNYPNPFNPSTSIGFKLPATSKVKLEVFNLLGSKVVTLVDKRLSAGTHSVNFDATNLSSGVYIYRIQAGEFSQTKKMLLIK